MSEALPTGTKEASNPLDVQMKGSSLFTWPNAEAQFDSVCVGLFVLVQVAFSLK